MVDGDLITADVRRVVATISCRSEHQPVCCMSQPVQIVRVALCPRSGIAGGREPVL